MSTVMPAQHGAQFRPVKGPIKLWCKGAESSYRRSIAHNCIHRQSYEIPPRVVAMQFPPRSAPDIWTTWRSPWNQRTWFL